MAIKNFQSVISMICAGNFAQIVHHWQTDDTGSHSPYALAKDLRDALISPAAGTSVLDDLCGVLSEDSYVSSVRALQIGVSGAPTAIKLLGVGAYAGIFDGNLDAAQVAGCIIWLTAGNAGLNGRTFVPGVSEEAYENGRPTADYKTAMGAFATTMLATVEGAIQDWELVLRHKPDPTFTAIVHAYLSPDAATQRRRLVPF